MMATPIILIINKAIKIKRKIAIEAYNKDVELNNKKIEKLPTIKNAQKAPDR